MQSEAFSPSYWEQVIWACLDKKPKNINHLIDDLNISYSTLRYIIAGHIAMGNIEVTAPEFKANRSLRVIPYKSGYDMEIPNLHRVMTLTDEQRADVIQEYVRRQDFEGFTVDYKHLLADCHVHPFSVDAELKRLVRIRKLEQIGLRAFRDVICA